MFTVPVERKVTNSVQHNEENSDERLRKRGNLFSDEWSSDTDWSREWIGTV